MTCVVCGSGVVRLGSRGPIPKYCKPACKYAASRTPKRREYERHYSSRQRAMGRRREYEYNYNRRPEVKERQRRRMMLRWHNDEAYRNTQLARWHNPYSNVEISAPYTGHRWLDMARTAASQTYVNPLYPSSDDYYDDMGEALLAILEGRDPKEAVKEYRSKEYASRRLFIRMGDWGDDEDEQRKFFEKVMPQVESAEDEAMTSIMISSRFNNVSTKSRHMKHRTQQPSVRRRKDGRSWQKHL